jgi:hypothetical protein
VGENYNQPAPQTEAEVLQAYQQYLPSLTNEAAAATPQVAQAGLNAAQQTQPGYNALNLSQLQQYALPEAQVGQQVANSNAQAGAETNLQQIEGAGGQAAAAATGLNRALNPDYYQAQDAASKGAEEGVNAINLTGLSPGEEAATERSLNQSNIGTGNLGLLNTENTVKNAVDFGGAFNNKLALLNNAVGAASTAANTAGNSGVNPVSIALGQPNPSTGTNFGSSQLTPANSSTSAGAQGNAFNFAGGLLNGMNSSNNALIGANAQTGAAQINANSPASYLGAVCCFIFLEAYHGKLPWCVRYGRDKYYNLNPDIATGYRRMAKWLVPLMQNFSFVRAMVWVFMVAPITSHLRRVTGTKRYNYNSRITHFWLRVWSILGKGKSEQDYAMTWRYN